MTTERYGGPLIMPPPQGDRNRITRTSWPPRLAMQQVLGSLEKACLMHQMENDKVNDISLWPLLSYALPTYAHVGTCTQSCVPRAHIWQKRSLVKLDSGFEVFLFFFPSLLLTTGTRTSRKPSVMRISLRPLSFYRFIIREKTCCGYVVSCNHLVHLCSHASGHHYFSQHSCL